MSATIKDIARLANVSIATVSNVINHKDGGFTPETKEKIIQVIQELDYKPNAAARSLITKSTKTIALIIPDIRNSFFSSIARGIEHVVSKHGYNIFLCNTDDSFARECDYIDILKEKCVDGIILTSNSIPSFDHISNLYRSGMPIVLLDRKIDVCDGYGVFLDNTRGGYLATKHLLELGHENIACITGPLYVESAADRLEGYKMALADFGVQPNDDYIFQGDYKVESGVRAAKKILKNKRFSAIFSCNDLMAVGAYKAMKAHGYHIPNDMSVVGFDDVELSQMIEPNLTTVYQPIDKMGVAAGNMLIQLINKKKITHKVLKFVPELIVRESTRHIC